MRCFFLLPLLLVASLSTGWSKPSAQIRTNLASPQFVGTVIGITAVPKEDGDPMKVLNKLRYRFAVSVDGAAFHIVGDFGPRPTFAWRPELYEHDARVKVTILNVES